MRFQGVVLHPMGSYPRVSDKQGMYDLFGPVKLYCKSYDKAMKMYLGCLQVLCVLFACIPSRLVCV